MRETQFKAWLKEAGKFYGSISSQMSKVRKLDRYYGDLDEHIRSGTIEKIETQLSNPDSIPPELGIANTYRHRSAIQARFSGLLQSSIFELQPFIN